MNLTHTVQSKEHPVKFPTAYQHICVSRCSHMFPPSSQHFFTNSSERKITGAYLTCVLCFTLLKYALLLFITTAKCYEGMLIYKLDCKQLCWERFRLSPLVVSFHLYNWHEFRENAMAVWLWCALLLLVAHVMITQNVTRWKGRHTSPR